MDAVQKATLTQLENIQKKTGKSLVELQKLAAASGLQKHGELRNLFKDQLGLGHGDANTLAGIILNPGALPGGDKPDLAEALDSIYTGAKAPLRPLHNAVMAEIEKLGDFEIVPKKTYLSLRRKKQFAMVGPGTKGRLEVGLNMKDHAPTPRLEQLPPGGMCQFRVFLTSPDEVDAELLAWVRSAFDAAE